MARFFNPPTNRVRKPLPTKKPKHPVDPSLSAHEAWKKKSLQRVSG